MRRLFGIAIVILLGVLVATNPGMDAFSTFVEQRSERILRRETGDSPLSRAIAGAGAGLAGSYVQRITTRHNYFVCSVYAIDLDGTEGDDAHDWRFLGIGTWFIELDNPDEKR